MAQGSRDGAGGGRVLSLDHQVHRDNEGLECCLALKWDFACDSLPRLGCCERVVNEKQGFIESFTARCERFC